MNVQGNEQCLGPRPTNRQVIWQGGFDRASAVGGPLRVEYLLVILANLRVTVLPVLLLNYTNANRSLHIEIVSVGPRLRINGPVFVDTSLVWTRAERPD